MKMNYMTVSYEIYENYQYEYEERNNEDIQAMIHDCLDTKDIELLDSVSVNDEGLNKECISVRSKESLKNIKKLLIDFSNSFNINFNKLEIHRG